MNWRKYPIYDKFSHIAIKVIEEELPFESLAEDNALEKEFSTGAVDAGKIFNEDWNCSTSVSRDTLDESPMACKPIDAILSRIGPAAEILEHIKPIYNFKAREQD